jgi:PAS domain-containing protein
MGYWDLKGLPLLHLHKGHIYFNAAVLEAVFTYNPRFSRTKELLNYFPERDQERIANAKTKLFRRLWSEVRIAFKDPDGMIFRTAKAYEKWAKDYLENIVQSSVDAIVTTDPKGRITFVNKAMEEMVGMSQKEINNLPIFASTWMGLQKLGKS